MCVYGVLAEPDSIFSSSSPLAATAMWRAISVVPVADGGARDTGWQQELPLSGGAQPSAGTGFQTLAARCHIPVPV